jgi:hypothetical protein
MRLKITRRLRTEQSEQWTLYDADRRTADGDFENVGKMDVHYTDDMAFVTLLLWSEFVDLIGDEVTQSIVTDLLDEVTSPIGVPTSYSLDYFSPSLSQYKFMTNDDLDIEDDDEEDDEEPNKNGRSW